MSFAIALQGIKTTHNIGIILRSAYNFGCSALYTIGRRYRDQHSDTIKAFKQIPLIHCLNWNDFKQHIPMGWIPIMFLVQKMVL